jgi:addiction module HigA family antidote
MLTNSTMKRRPTLPGEVLLVEYLRPAGITHVELAARMGVPIQRVNGVISGRRAFTPSSREVLARSVTRRCRRLQPPTAGDSAAPRFPT